MTIPPPRKVVEGGEKQQDTDSWSRKHCFNQKLQEDSFQLCMPCSMFNVQCKIQFSVRPPGCPNLFFNVSMLEKLAEVLCALLRVAGCPQGFRTACSESVRVVEDCKGMLRVAELTLVAEHNRPCPPPSRSCLKGGGGGEHETTRFGH